jgi:hypothetical protein
LSIDTTRNVRAIRIEVGDELDLADDEYGDNEMAIFMFATVEEISEYRDEDSDLWLKIDTTQGTYDFPAGHWIKVKVME